MALKQCCFLVVVVLTQKVVDGVAPFDAAGNALRHIQKSSAEVYKMQREGMRLRKERKENPESIDFVKHAAVTQSGADAGKIFNLLFITIYARWWAPVTVYFFPDMLPSPFESEAQKVKKANRLLDQRRKAVIQAVSEDEALSGHVVDALRASSKAKALDNVVFSTRKCYEDAALKQLPNPVFFATSRVFEGPYRVLPKYFHVRAIRAGVRKIAEGDEALRRSDLNTLSPKLLQTACLDRSLSCASKSEMVNGLNEWLSLTQKYDADHDKLSFECSKARLALLAINTASTCRKNDKAFVALYGKPTF